MQSNKPSIPKDVAESIEYFWSRINQDKAIKHLALTNWKLLRERSCYNAEILENFCKNNPETYMSALVNDYEIEKSPEEKIRGKYFDDNTSFEFKKGVRFVLETLNIANILDVHFQKKSLIRRRKTNETNYRK